MDRQTYLALLYLILVPNALHGICPIYYICRGREIERENMVNSNEKWFHNATSDVLAGNCIRFDSDWNTVCLSAWWRYLGSFGVACTACSLIHYFFFFYFSWIRIFISTELAQQAFGSSISRWANYIFVFCFYYYFTIFSFALTVVDDCLPFSRHFVCSNWTIKIMRFDCFWHFFFYSSLFCCCRCQSWNSYAALCILSVLGSGKFYRDVRFAIEFSNQSRAQSCEERKKKTTTTMELGCEQKMKMKHFLCCSIVLLSFYLLNKIGKWLAVGFDLSSVFGDVSGVSDGTLGFGTHFTR